MMQTLSKPAPTLSVPPPLAVEPDMSASWKNTSTEFDAAAQVIIDAHKSDGIAADNPVMDLRAWGLVPEGGRLAIAPLGKQHGPLLLRSNAFSNLATRLGAPTEFVRDRLPAPLQLSVMNWLLTASDRPIPATLRVRGE